MKTLAAFAEYISEIIKYHDKDPRHLLFSQVWNLIKCQGLHTLSKRKIIKYRHTENPPDQDIAILKQAIAEYGLCFSIEQLPMEDNNALSILISGVPRALHPDNMAQADKVTVLLLAYLYEHKDMDSTCKAIQQKDQEERRHYPSHALFEYDMLSMDHTEENTHKAIKHKI
jgi:hypothetical protein